MKKETPITYNDLSMRYEFSTVNDRTPIPNVLKISKVSYNNFIQRFTNYKQRTNQGLESILKQYFGKDYVGYVFGVCKYNSEQCLDKNMTFAIPTYVILRDGKRTWCVHKYFIGNIPLLTKNGSFILNGVENHIINQLIRDSGIYINMIHGPQVINSIKLRGEYGKTLQIDQLHSYFIGRKINFRNLRKKYSIGTYQNILSLLDNILITFKEAVHALTYTTMSYRYTQNGLYLCTDWRFFKKSKYVLKKTCNTLIFNNIHPVYSEPLDTEHYHQMLNTKIVQVFFKNTEKGFSKSNYIIIDIFYKNRKSIFTPEMCVRLGISNILKLLKCVGKKLDILYNMEDLFTHIQFKYDLYIYVISLDEKGNYYNSLVQRVIELKKKIYSFFADKISITLSIRRTFL